MFLDLVNGLLGSLADLDPAVLLALTGLFTALETSALIGLLVPGDAVVLLAGTTATSPPRFAALVGVVVAGSLAGESVGYLLGRRFGDRLRSSRLGRRLGEHNWAKAERFLNGSGGRAVFAARFVAVVHALLPVMAGTVRMPYRRFVAWAAAGSLAWSLAYVGTGAAAGASWREYGDRLGLVGYLVPAVLLTVALLARIIRRRRRDGVLRLTAQTLISQTGQAATSRHRHADQPAHQPPAGLQGRGKKAASHHEA
ncbi:MAG TPA: DedA family protein [Actinomycetes bacterium]|nr:DedA family protein [Actinomycetes bacterium]